MTETKISIDAHAFRRYPDDDALRAVAAILGPPEAWAPTLIESRLGSDFHADWKLEVGRWLLTAQEYGFLPPLQNRLIRRAKKEAENPEVTGPNDSAQAVLDRELAGAMVTYYFTSLGWKFVSWEPPTVKGDVDVRLRSPTGLTVDVQVKAPDQPGRVAIGPRVDGEYDERVLKSVDKGMKQLSSSPGPARMVVISPRRDFPVKADVLPIHLLGSPRSVGESWWGVVRDNSAGFARPPGTAVSAVADLTLLPGRMNATLYRCTVVCNPWVATSGVLSPDEFPHARVLSLRGGEFVWLPEEPGRCSKFRSGLPYLEEAGV